jgi:hypothetical protein
LAGAEASAAVICAVVTEVPAEVTVLQAVVVHWAQLLDGIPPEIPTSVQSIARLELMMPDQACAWAMAGKIERAIKASKTDWMRFMFSRTP